MTSASQFARQRHLHVARDLHPSPGWLCGGRDRGLAFRLRTESASEIVVANTKGFTGHPMGAGIEDGVVVKALQYGVVPPLANLQGA